LLVRSARPPHRERTQSLARETKRIAEEKAAAEKERDGARKNQAEAITQTKEARIARDASQRDAHQAQAEANEQKNLRDAIAQATESARRLSSSPPEALALAVSAVRSAPTGEAVAALRQALAVQVPHDIFEIDSPGEPREWCAAPDGSTIFERNSKSDMPGLLIFDVESRQKRVVTCGRRLPKEIVCSPTRAEAAIRFGDDRLVLANNRRPIHAATTVLPIATSPYQGNLHYDAAGDATLILRGRDAVVVNRLGHRLGTRTVPAGYRRPVLIDGSHDMLLLDEERHVGLLPLDPRADIRLSSSLAPADATIYAANGRSITLNHGESIQRWDTKTLMPVAGELESTSRKLETRLGDVRFDPTSRSFTVEDRDPFVIVGLGGSPQLLPGPRRAELLVSNVNGLGFWDIETETARGWTTDTHGGDDTQPTDGGVFRRTDMGFERWRAPTWRTIVRLQEVDTRTQSEEVRTGVKRGTIQAAALNQAQSVAVLQLSRPQQNFVPAVAIDVAKQSVFWASPPEPKFYRMTMSQAGRYIVLTSTSGESLVFDGPKPPQVIKWKYSDVKVLITDLGLMVADSGHYDESLELVRLSDPAHPTLVEHDGCARGGTPVAISSDGTLLALKLDSRISVCDVAHNRILTTVPGEDAAFDDHAKAILTTREGALDLWVPGKSGWPARSRKHTVATRDRRSSLEDSAISTDGRFAFMREEHGTHVWDLQRGDSAWSASTGFPIRFEGTSRKLIYHTFTTLRMEECALCVPTEKLIELASRKTSHVVVTEQLPFEACNVQFP
jgi:hypothetical protein